MTITSARRNSKPENQSVSSQWRPKNGNGRRPRINGRSTSVDPKSKYNEFTSRAQKAAASGDTIAAEYLYQHADHYYRVMQSN